MRPLRGGWRYGARVAGALIVILAAWLAYRSWVPSPEPVAPPLSRFRPLTSYVGSEHGPSWSPDGAHFAYGHTESGSMDIFVRAAEGGEPIRRTVGPADDGNPRWSPDGDHLAFVSGRGGTCGIYLVPPFEGDREFLVDTRIPAVERVGIALSSLGSRPWSPDAEVLLFSRRDPSGQIAIWRMDLHAGSPTRLTRPPAGSEDLSASFSFDGEWIAFDRRSGGRGSIWLMPASGDSERLLVGDRFDNAQPVWSVDDREVLFASNRSGVADLWSIEVASGRTRQLTSGGGGGHWPLAVVPAISRNGRLAFNQWTHQTDLYSLSVETGTEERLTENTRDNFGARISPDGETIVYQSSRSGNFEIWLRNRANGAEHRITDHAANDVFPDWSPDGAQLLFVSNRGGEFHLWVVERDGTGLRRLSKAPIRLLPAGFASSDLAPRWAPDGNAIGYLAPSEGGPALWVVSPEGESLGPILCDVQSFDWYGSSRRVIYTRRMDAGSMNMVARDLESGEEVVLRRHEEAHSEIAVSPDGSAVAYLRSVSHFHMDLYLLPLVLPTSASGLPRPAADGPRPLTDGQGVWHVHNGGWSPSSDEIVFTRDTDAGDILLLETSGG